MEPASPARLYATTAGALLVLLGILGFFYSASLGSPGSVEPALGALRVNGWLNLLHVAIGSLGLLLAGSASRRYSLLAGAFFTALAVWGFAIGAGDAFLRLLPAGGGDDALHLALGLLGLAAAAGTPRPERPSGRRSSSKSRPRGRPRRLEPRAKAAGKGA